MSGTSNFRAWDPVLNNAESDAAYEADTMRQTGAPVGALLPSALFNKLAAQVSMLVAALGQALANKGISVSDADYATLVVQMGKVWTTADIIPPMISVAYATSLAFNAELATGWDVVLTGDVTASSLANYSPGQILIFIVAQDGIGGRAFSWPPEIPSALPVAQGPNAVTVEAFIVGSDNSVLPLLLPSQPQSQIAYNSGSRTFAGVYQNTFSTVRRVSLIVHLDNNSNVSCYSDSNPFPTTVLAGSASFTGFATVIAVTVTFDVLPGNYYTVKNIGSAPASILIWSEQQ